MLDEEASAFLVPLRALAREGRFAEIALLIGGSNQRKAVRDYLKNRLFALIISNHPPFLADQARASAWSAESAKEWSATIARDAGNPRRLPGLVDAMLADLRDWQPRRQGA
jgi:hypothetical protein